MGYTRSSVNGPGSSISTGQAPHPSLGLPLGGLPRCAFGLELGWYAFVVALMSFLLVYVLHTRELHALLLPVHCLRRGQQEGTQPAVAAAVPLPLAPPFLLLLLLLLLQPRAMQCSTRMTTP